MELVCAMLSESLFTISQVKQNHSNDHRSVLIPLNGLITVNLNYSFITFLELFCPPVLTSTNLKRHKILALKTTFTQENLKPGSTFNTPLALNGLRTTWLKKLN